MTTWGWGNIAAAIKKDGDYSAKPGQEYVGGCLEF
ncbi:hypothetical protein COLO4_04963 [Corchorus olitorius]|uniref:Uncharacterized protein n=1 Tax=Corchorus olitorius TaxID=93759 RepID=A0A1R3KSC8_9ROSI|nr:hypothetical protein COLO4_04963 [Corchorus olitorius]